MAAKNDESSYTFESVKSSERRVMKPGAQLQEMSREANQSFNMLLVQEKKKLTSSNIPKDQH